MNILWNPNEAVEILEMPLPLITEGTQDMGNGVYWLKAGTPLDEYFAVSNDEDAKYIVAEDFYFISSKPDQAKVVPLITGGYVDINKAEQAAGITYSQDCIDALADEGIVLVDGTLPSSGGGGGGGGGALVVTLTSTVVNEQEIWSTDKTAGEIFAALPNATFQQANNSGIYKIYSTAAYAEMDGLFYIELLALAELNSPNFAPMEMYAASADAVMTTEEPSEPPAGPAG